MELEYVLLYRSQLESNKLAAMHCDLNQVIS
jgi:hypothetical protein